MKNRIRTIGILIFILLNMSAVYGQGPSLSPYDLKESYLEKRASYERNGTKLVAADNQMELDRILSVLEENAPNSYEYHYVKYVNSNYDGTANGDLLAAYKLKPDAREIIVELFGYYELIGDYQKSKEFANAVKRKLSSDQITYFKHLMSIENAAYLIMSGEDDAYAAMALQRLGEIKSISKIINLDFLQNDTYRKSIEKEFGIASIPFKGNEAKFISAIVNKQPTRIAISTTVSQNYLSMLQNSTFIVGLTYRVNPESQMSDLEKFWGASKQLLISATLNARADKGLFQNFLPPLLTLYKLQKHNGKSDKELRKAIELLATRINKTAQVNEILKAYDQIE